VDRLSGILAFTLWILLCLRWFDPAQPMRPGALQLVPPALLAAAWLAAFLWWLRDRWGQLVDPLGDQRAALLLVVGVAFFFRLPMAWWGSTGYLTSDGSLSGTVAVHLRDGIDHLVFIPNSGYSGSLKAHLTVILSALTDMPRAFAFASLLFYLVFVAGVYRLGALVDRSTGLFAGLYLAFAPAWVTHYSLSNDGNYVEVLAFGTWALFLATRWISSTENRPLRATGIGLLLGLAFWCHILAVLYAAAIAVVLLAFGRRSLLRSLPGLAAGFVAGYFPGLIWNARNDWFSLGYLATGAHQEDPVAATAFPSRILPMITDHWPILMGYDAWYPPLFDAISRVLAWFAVAAAVVASGLAVVAAWRRPAGVRTVLLVFTVTNLVLALVGAEHIPNNPRYLLFLMSAIPVLLAAAFGAGARRAILGVLVAFGALGSIATLPPSAATDARWRGFVAGLEGAGVRYCHTDFYFAAKINFLSEGRILCSSRLGPTYSDYFRNGPRVDAAPQAALIPINRTKAAKLEAALTALGVSYERLDLMKPVLYRFSRKVDPDELRGLPQRLGSTRR
jgi:Dolichyl-phosphate-mannose-protein mannosyltransferase